MNKIHSICPPFSYLTMPPYDIASAKALLEKYGINMTVDLLYFDYAVELGGSIYNTLHDSLGCDLIFSALLFPENKVRLLDSWMKNTRMSISEFDSIIDKTKNFCLDYAEKNRVKLGFSDVIHFHLYTKSMLASIYLAKIISERFDKQIWLSGYHCQGECGESLKKIFPFISKVIEKDMEVCILKDFGAEEICDTTLDFLPPPDYSDFIDVYTRLPEDFKRDYLSRYSFQVEFNRGCWWNKCSFCTLNCQYSSFMEKSIDNIINIYKTLIKNYSTMQIIVYERNSTSHWKEIVDSLDKEFPGMKGKYNLSFKVSSLTNPSDIKFLKEHKVNFLVGTECFSSNCLKLVNKGQRVIESILMLKYVERYGAKCYHNFMYSLPFETEDDYIETEKNVDILLHLPPPFDLEEFRLTYGSDIYRFPEKYCVSEIKIRRDFEYLLIPVEYHDKYVPFFYDFSSVNGGIEERKKRWISLVEKWRRIYYRDAYNGMPKSFSLLHMHTCEGLIEIYDSRYDNMSRVYTYTGLAGKIYTYCDSIRTVDEIFSEFGENSEKEINKYLDDFIGKKIMFREGASFLSLAV